ncbi:RNA 2-O ribose methyltransferase substrate binding domain-containing protein [Stackebrandtia soli]
MPDVITSATNPVVKRVRALADRKNRRRESVFVVHGIQPVWQAVDGGAQIDTLLVAPGLLTHEPSLELVDEQRRRGTRVVEFSDELFGRISDRDRPAGIAAIVHQRLSTLQELGTPELAIALHEVGNPGNLGTILRTAEAAGATAVILLGDTTDPFDPTSAKASMGALFNVSIARAGVDEFFAWARERGITIAAAAGDAARDYREVGYAAPLTVLLGSEGDGLPVEVVDAADLAISIPMSGKTESLNLSIAAGIVLYEARRHIIG